MPSGRIMLLQRAVKLAASVTEALTPNKLIEATATETTLANFFASNIMNTSNFYIT